MADKRWLRYIRLARHGPSNQQVFVVLRCSPAAALDLLSQFSAACVGHFGSGWVWLVYGVDGKLKVTQGHDAVNPLRDGQVPLLTCDVWEHAYYVDRRNARPAYVEAWWRIVDWTFVNTNLTPVVPAMAPKGLCPGFL